MVMAHALVQVLRREHGNCAIHVVAPPVTAPLASRMPGLAAVHELEVGHGVLGLGRRRRLAAKLRTHGFQAAYVLPNSFKSALLPWWAGIPHRVGWHGEARYRLLNDRRRLDKTRYPRMIDRFMSLGLPAEAPLPEPWPRPELSVDRNNRESVLERLALVGGRRRGRGRILGRGREVAKDGNASPVRDGEMDRGATANPVRGRDRDMHRDGAKHPREGQVRNPGWGGDMDEDGSAHPVEDGCPDRNRLGPVTVLCPGAEYGEAKRWPAANFAAVARQRLRTGDDVWILGSAGDAAVAGEIAAAAPGAVDLAGRTSLLDAVDLLSLADRVVTNDSGLMHIACALDRRVVAVFGSTSPDFTPPLGKRATVIEDQLDCRPCFQRQCPLQHLDCLRGIAPERVIAALMP